MEYRMKDYEWHYSRNMAGESVCFLENKNDNTRCAKVRELTHDLHEYSVWHRPDIEKDEIHGPATLDAVKRVILEHLRAMSKKKAKKETQQMTTDNTRITMTMTALREQLGLEPDSVDVHYYANLKDAESWRASSEGPGYIANLERTDWVSDREMRARGYEYKVTVRPDEQMTDGYASLILCQLEDRMKDDQEKLSNRVEILLLEILKSVGFTETAECYQELFVTAKEYPDVSRETSAKEMVQ